MAAPDHQTLIFLHIPKTGGLTVRSIMYRMFSPQQVMVLRYKTYGTAMRALERFKATPESDRSKIKVLTGHIHYGFHDHLPQPSNYFTMLRHPVEQVVSFYYHRLKTLPHLLINPETDEPYSLEEYISGQIAPEKHHYVVIDNLMTRRLSTTGGEPHFVGFGKCTSEMLETAKANLKNRFTTVGLTERFDESLLLLFRKLGWPTPYYTKVNVNKKRPATRQLDPKIIELIHQHNGLDLELYQYAQILLEEAIAQEGSAFQSQIARFQWINRHVANPLLTARGFIGSRLNRSSTDHPHHPDNLPDFNSI